MVHHPYSAGILSGEPLLMPPRANLILYSVKLNNIINNAIKHKNGANLVLYSVKLNNIINNAIKHKNGANLVVYNVKLNNIINNAFKVDMK